MKNAPLGMTHGVQLMESYAFEISLAGLGSEKIPAV
jgi:hypothetical protein